PAPADAERLRLAPVARQRGGQEGDRRRRQDGGRGQSLRASAHGPEPAGASRGCQTGTDRRGNRRSAERGAWTAPTGVEQTSEIRGRRRRGIGRPPTQRAVRPIRILSLVLVI